MQSGEEPAPGSILDREVAGVDVQARHHGGEVRERYESGEDAELRRVRREHLVHPFAPHLPQYPPVRRIEPDRAFAVFAVELLEVQRHDGDMEFFSEFAGVAGVRRVGGERRRREGALGFGGEAQYRGGVGARPAHEDHRPGRGIRGMRSKKSFHRNGPEILVFGVVRRVCRRCEYIK